MSNFKGNAVKLYVFVDNPEFRSERPILVIINKYKCVADLRKEFADNQNYLAEEQFWIIDNICYDDDTEINDIMKYAKLFQGGFMTYLYILSKEEKNKILQFIDTYLEEMYAKVNPNERWNDPIGDPIIISDKFDSSKPIPVVGWNCETCTFFNKAFNEYCLACGCSRPVNFIMPKNIYLTQEDNKIIMKQEEDEKMRKKLEEEHKKEMIKEREEYRKRLEEMYKHKVAYTNEPSECPICVMEYPAGEAVVLHGCHHAVCKDCLKGYLTMADDPRVKCPTENCVGIIEDGEISEILTEEEYKRYEQLNLRTAESKTANTFHCKLPNCTAWVVYDDNVNFFDCPLCKNKNCILCGAIHEPQTCKEYQEELQIKARNDMAAKKDLEFLDNLIKTGAAMKCPGCKIIVQKKSGCDWMQCNMCKTEICWATKGPRWGPKGKGDNTGGCKCNYYKQRCHPKCGNCH